MVLWLLLFLLIVAISFLLAYQSMKDYQERPGFLKSDNGLFLIKNPANLTRDVLEKLHQALLSGSRIISIERLFKGSKKALVIFGPKSILHEFTDILSLLELEDYTNINTKFYAWEAISKDPISMHMHLPKVSKNIPPIKDSEQVWWQISLQPQSSSLWPYQTFALKKAMSSNPEVQSMIAEKNQQKTYQAQIRFVVVAEEIRQKEIAQSLENIENKLVKIPRPFTNNQILDSYKARAKSYGDLTFLTSDELANLS